MFASVSGWAFGRDQGCVRYLAISGIDCRSARRGCHRQRFISVGGFGISFLRGNNFLLLGFDRRVVLSRFTESIERRRQVPHAGPQIDGFADNRLIGCTAGTRQSNLIETPAAVAFGSFDPRPDPHHLERRKRRVLLTASTPPQDRADQQEQPDEHQARGGQVDEAFVCRVGEVAAEKRT